MSYSATKWARAQRLHPTPKTVLLYLAERADGKRGEYCFPGQPTIAAATGLGIRTVGLAIQYLVEMGYLERGRRVRANGSRTSDDFVIVTSDGEMDVRSYGEWYAHKRNPAPRDAQTQSVGTTGRNAQHLRTQSVGATGPEKEDSRSKNRKVLSTQLESSDTESASSESSDAREALALAKVGQAYAESIPGRTDQELYEFFTRLESIDRSDHESEGVRTLHESLGELVSQEIWSRVLGSDR